jgi:integrase
VKVLGKGNKWDSKKISNELYAEIMERCAEAEGDKIFTLTDKTVNKMMEYIRSHIDFGERKITFHSLKKSSIEEVRLITSNDVNAMQQHAGHSDPSVTLRSYVANKKLDDLVMVDINQHIPVEAFEHLTHEQLLSLVLSMDRNTQIKMLQKMGVF